MLTIYRRHNPDCANRADRYCLSNAHPPDLEQVRAHLDVLGKPEAADMNPEQELL